REGSLRTVELAGDVEQVTRIETDFERRTRIGDRKLLRRAAGIGVRHRKRQAAFIEIELHRPRLLRRDRRNAIDGLGETLAIDLHDLVVAGRDHAAIIGEGAVDELRGQHNAAELETYLGFRNADGDRTRITLEKF